MRISDWSSDVCSSDLPHQEIAEYKTRGKDSEGHADEDGPVVRQRRQQPRLEIARDQTADDRLRREEAGARHGYRLASHRKDDAGKQRAEQHGRRSEEHTSELKSIMRHTYDVS